MEREGKDLGGACLTGPDDSSTKKERKEKERLKKSDIKRS